MKFLKVLVSVVFAGVLVFGIAMLKVERSKEMKRELFTEKSSSQNLVGKTPPQVIGILGQPDYDYEYSGGARTLTYSGPSREGCRVEFVKGIATKVVNWNN